MQASEWFKLWFGSPYYDLLYRHRNKAEAAKLVDKLVDYLHIAADCYVLDAACGKGRHSIALAEKGCNVTGIDICPVAIEAAKKYETDRLHFYLHDMRLPFYINYFNYTFNFFTSFGYFRTNREHNDALRTIAQSLKPNGFFVMDYLNASHVEVNLTPKEIVEINNVEFDIEKTSDEDHFYKKIKVHDKLSNLNEEFTERVEKFSLDDFNKMFLKQNLQIEKVFGDYDLNDYDEKNSPRMIIIAKKIS